LIYNFIDMNNFYFKFVAQSKYKFYHIINHHIYFFEFDNNGILTFSSSWNKCRH